jgi:Rieske Fe-S protein
MSAPTGIQRSRLDPEPVPRRDWLGLASLWSAGVALLFSLFGMIRLPKPAVVGSPSKRFRVSLPEALAPGAAFVPPGRSVAIFRDPEGVYAISLVCTHLGCVVKTGPRRLRVSLSWFTFRAGRPRHQGACAQTVALAESDSGGRSVDRG